MRYLELISENLQKQILGEEPNEIKYFINEAKTIGIDRLPYSYAAIRRFIDPETMKIHYQRHYKGYVKKLNSALRKKDYGDVELENIVKQISKYNTTIRNNAGGAFNHALFWKMLSPKFQQPNGPILEKIKSQFGTYRNFRTLFEKEAKKRFGSGWVWLVVKENGSLKIMTTPNQDNPLMNIFEQGGFPILGLDLWEHSYYLKYQNKRDDYIHNFWEVVNWKFVNELYLKKTKKDKKLVKESYQATKSDFAKYSSIFSNNEELMLRHAKCIMNIFRNAYPDNFYKWGEYCPDCRSGLYDLEKPGRSVLNKLTSNIYGFVILLNDVNTVLEKTGQPKIIIDDTNINEHSKQLDRLCQMLNRYGSRIFPKSKTVDNIWKLLGITHEKGEKLENEIVKRLNDKFGKGTASVNAGLGVSSDIEGLDATINLDGIEYTSQIKPIENLKFGDGFFIIKIKGRVAKYNTDLLVFGNPNKPIYIFKNQNVDSTLDFYKIPQENLLLQVD
jgi:Fe-Mn family superoxide dismutase